MKRRPLELAPLRLISNTLSYLRASPVSKTDPKIFQFQKSPTIFIGDFEKRARERDSGNFVLSFLFVAVASNLDFVGGETRNSSLQVFFSSLFSTIGGVFGNTFEDSDTDMPAQAYLPRDLLDGM